MREILTRDRVIIKNQYERDDMWLIETVSLTYCFSSSHPRRERSNVDVTLTSKYQLPRSPADDNSRLNNVWSLSAEKKYKPALPLKILYSHGL